MTIEPHHLGPYHRKEGEASTHCRVCGKPLEEERLIAFVGEPTGRYVAIIALCGPHTDKEISVALAWRSPNRSGVSGEPAVEQSRRRPPQRRLRAL
jgi:hypothetical protein